MNDDVATAAHRVLQEETLILRDGLRAASLASITMFFMVAWLYTEWSVHVRGELLGAVIVAYSVGAAALIFAAIYFAVRWFVRRTRAKRVHQSAKLSEVSTVELEALLF